MHVIDGVSVLKTSCSEFNVSLPWINFRRNFQKVEYLWNPAQLEDHRLHFRELEMQNIGFWHLSVVWIRRNPGSYLTIATVLYQLLSLPRTLVHCKEECRDFLLCGPPFLPVVFFPPRWFKQSPVQLSPVLRTWLIVYFQLVWFQAFF